MTCQMKHIRTENSGFAGKKAGLTIPRHCKFVM